MTTIETTTPKQFTSAELRAFRFTPQTAPAAIDLFGDGKYVGSKLLMDSGSIMYEVQGPRAKFYLMARAREDGSPSCESFFLVRSNGNVASASIHGNNSFRILPDSRVTFWSEWR
jgi:hypothetical protein